MAISIPLRPVFASWLGWLAPADRPLIIVRDHDQDAADIAWQAAKIGYDNIIGELDGGVAAYPQNVLAVGLRRASPLSSLFSWERVSGQ